MKKQAVSKPKNKKEFFGWGEKKYTKDDVQKLMETIKEFNCGAIDSYLTKHVDKVFKEWLKNTK
jgi:hypothetical protein